MTEAEKRENLDRDLALDRFQKGVCPTCERSVDTQNPLIDFCSHCGFSLFKKCKHCGTRHNSLELFCHSCGKKHEEMTYTISATNDTIHALITKEMEKHGPNCSLNHIDVSQVTDMGGLFAGGEFNGDVSQWDTSNVTDMNYLFFQSDFNGDISKWNTSRVTTMSNTFCGSSFNGDISKWDTSQVTTMSNTFCGSSFNGDISKWNTSSVTNMFRMFYNSQFNGDINQWNVSNVGYMSDMFDQSRFTGDLRLWNWTEKQLRSAFKGAFKPYLEVRRSILECNKLKESFGQDSIVQAQKTRAL